MWHPVIAVGVAVVACCVVLGATVVDDAAVTESVRVRVLNGTVVPSRKQFLMFYQLMSRIWTGGTHTTPLCVAHAVSETVLNDCARARAATTESRNREPRILD